MAVKKPITSKQFDEWIKALRSGNFIQSRGTLFNETPTGKTYCCLGVLCEINNFPMKLGQTEIYKSYDNLFNTLYDEYLLTREVQAGCMLLNDNLNLTFSQIANRLEKRKESILKGEWL